MQASTIVPRDYQEEDVNAIIEELKSVRSTLYVAATGLGKTVVMTETVKRTGLRALMLAHRSELISQARSAFLRQGIEVEIEKAELVASTNLFNRAPVVLATVQTLSSGKEDRKRMHRFNPKDFGLLLYDESHHSVSKGNKAIVDYFLNGNPELKVVGVTATPDRADEEALGQIFESVASERDVLFGVDEGWLVEPQQMMVTVGGLDFSHMRTTAGDLNGADLAAAMESESSIQGVVQPVLETMFRLEVGTLSSIAPDQWFTKLTGAPMQTIVFTVSVHQAEMLCNIFNRVMPNLASWVSGKTPEQERRDIFRNFEDRRSSILVNCGVTTEGYDNPEVSLVAIARPTKSRSLYAQMIGRGTRPLPRLVDGLPNKEARLAAIKASSKPTMIVMDFVGNSGKHKLVTTADILGGKVSAEAAKIAEMKAKAAKKPVNMRELMEEEERKIREEAERRRLAEESRKAKLVAKVSYSRTAINPFDMFDITPRQSHGWDDYKVLSPRQTDMLLKQGIDPSKLTYAEGRAMVNEIFRRWNNKLCTTKQASLLKKHYPELDVRELPMKQASAMIDALAKNGWRRPT